MFYDTEIINTQNIVSAECLGPIHNMGWMGGGGGEKYGSGMRKGPILWDDDDDMAMTEY